MAAAVLAIGLVEAANSQDTTRQDMEEQLLACDKIVDMAEKLACFDAVVQGMKGPAATAAEPPPPVSGAPSAAEPPPAAISETPGTAPPAAPAAAGSSTPAPAAETPPDVLQPTSATTREHSPTPSAPPAKTAAATAAAPAVVRPTAAEAPVDPVDEFGRDSMQGQAAEEEEPAVAEKQEKEEAKLSSLRATIVRSWMNNDGRFSVELDNGQIWRETQASQTRYTGDNDMVFGAPRSSRGRMPKVGRTVDISEGRLSGYWMRIEGIRQGAWVRRTR